MRPEFCSLRPEKGSCHSLWHRYYYDPDLGRCVPFEFGGCGGNENNFRSVATCEAVCKRSLRGEADSIFEQFLKNAQQGLNDPKPTSVVNVSTDFDLGFDGWTARSWRLFPYDSAVARELNISGSPNASSTKGATPISSLSLMMRPTLMRPLTLLKDHLLTVRFDLRVTGKATREQQHPHPLQHVLLQTLYPGFKVYLGSYLAFTLSSTSWRIRNSGPAPLLQGGWRSYEVNEDTNRVLHFPHQILDRTDVNTLMVRVEAWEGHIDRTWLVLDDLSLIQTPANRSSGTAVPPTRSSSAPAETTHGPEASFPCSLDKSEGPCLLNLTRFYYDDLSHSCKAFRYSGCKGNANNFVQLDTCRQACTSGDGTSSWTSRTSTTRISSTDNATAESILLGKVSSSGQDEAAEGPSAGLVTAEAVLAAVLSVLFLVAMGLLHKYYKAYRAKENYRIFNNEHRNDSVTDTYPIVTPADPGVSMSYNNPSYDHHMIPEGEDVVGTCQDDCRSIRRSSCSVAHNNNDERLGVSIPMNAIPRSNLVHEDGSAAAGP